MDRSCVYVRVHKFGGSVGDPLNIVKLSFRCFLFQVRILFSYVLITQSFGLCQRIVVSFLVGIDILQAAQFR
jgi:hypothetical protein